MNSRIRNELKKKYGPKYWIRANGTAVLITDMDDHHLLNTIRLIRRQVDIYRQKMLDIIEKESEESVASGQGKQLHRSYELMRWDDDQILSHVDRYAELETARLQRGLERLLDQPKELNLPILVPHSPFEMD